MGNKSKNKKYKYAPNPFRYKLNYDDGQPNLYNNYKNEQESNVNQALYTINSNNQAINNRSVSPNEAYMYPNLTNEQLNRATIDAGYKSATEGAYGMLPIPLLNKMERIGQMGRIGIIDDAIGSVGRRIGKVFPKKSNVWKELETLPDDYDDITNWARKNNKTVDEVSDFQNAHIRYSNEEAAAIRESRIKQLQENIAKRDLLSKQTDFIRDARATEFTPIVPDQYGSNIMESVLTDDAMFNTLSPAEKLKLFNGKLTKESTYPGIIRSANSKGGRIKPRRIKRRINKK